MMVDTITDMQCELTPLLTKGTLVRARGPIAIALPSGGCIYLKTGTCGVVSADEMSLDLFPMMQRGVLVCFDCGVFDIEARLDLHQIQVVE